jgi:hypothetical protein
MRYWQIVEPEGATHLLSVTFLSRVRYHHRQLKTSAQKWDQSWIIMFIGQLCGLRPGMIDLTPEICPRRAPVPAPFWARFLQLALISYG